MRSNRRLISMQAGSRLSSSRFEGRQVYNFEDDILGVFTHNTKTFVVTYNETKRSVYCLDDYAYAFEVGKPGQE